ncbi:MAG: metalloregulator ArsR/SmtB family transcription factor [Planctomycetes bacterium]|jgi:DNA-binding transcriptional ArsR family regulator|nr:metalloregulator ArsR/SmtB family transcription factor [Planctomycetota bacterium]
MQTYLAINKALSDENRVRVMLALAGGEMCVCQIIELLGLAPSTVSKHMHVLQQAGLVDARKEGRWIYYRRADSDAVRDRVALLDESLAGDPTARSDARRLKRIRQINRSKLCCHYH